MFFINGKSNITLCILLLYAEYVQGITSSVQRFIPRGVVVPVFTPFLCNEKINYDVIPEYINFLATNRVNGIVVTSIIGEAVALNVDERIQVLHAFTRAARGAGLPIVAQIGSNSLPENRVLAKHAELLGVDAIITLPDLFYKSLTTDEMVNYVAAVSKAAPSLPILYSNLSKFTNVTVLPREFFSPASSKISNFAGIISHITDGPNVLDLVRPDQVVYMAEPMVVSAVNMGFGTVCTGISNLFPKLVVDIFNATEKGHLRTAKTLQSSLDKIILAIQEDKLVLDTPAMKAAMEMVTGIPLGPVRQPLFNLEPARLQQIANNLASLGIKVFI